MIWWCIVPLVLLFLLGWWAMTAPDGPKPTGEKMTPSSCAKIAWVNGYADDAQEWEAQK